MSRIKDIVDGTIESVEASVLDARAAAERRVVLTATSFDVAFYRSLDVTFTLLVLVATGVLVRAVYVCVRRPRSAKRRKKLA